MSEFIVSEYADAAGKDRTEMLQGLVDRYLFEQWAAVCRQSAKGAEERA